MQIARSVALRCCCGGRPLQDEVAWFIAQGCLPGVHHGSAVGRKVRVVMGRATTMAVVAVCTCAIVGVCTVRFEPARALQHHWLHPQSPACDFVGLATLISCGSPWKVLLSTVTTTLQCSTVPILPLAPWLLYPSVFRTGTLVILYHGHEMHVSAEKAIPVHLTVRWTEEINY